MNQTMLRLPKNLANKIQRFSRNYQAGTKKKYVLGCGSNVVDQIFKVQAVPNIGEKGFFLSPTKTLEASIVGGVTLNHLAWASLLGVPSGLLALQGDDNSGRLIRKSLKRLGINTEHVIVKDSFSSAESYVFLQSDGERSIIMASGSTSSINDDAVDRYFSKAIKNDASMVTTEISQVPLSGVIKLLINAKNENIMSAVDLDVSPSVALNEAKLGTMEELSRALSLVDIIKPTLHAAEEFLQIKRPDLKRSLDPDDVVKYLLEITDTQLIAITNGAKDSILGTKANLIKVPVKKVDKIVDATGAGDAFFGGLIAGIHYNGFPNTEEALWELGELSNKTGAYNCMVLGGLPNEDSKTRLQREINNFKSKSSLNNSDMAHIAKSEISTKEIFIESLKRDHFSIGEMSNLINLEDVKRFIAIIDKCTGNIFTSGIGKSGIVARRLAASLSSIGMPSHYVHVTEWRHGDLGKIRSDDVIIFFSHSGNTEEVVHAMQLMKRRNINALAILGTEASTIGKECDSYISYKLKNLVEPLGGIPTTSIVLQEAIINGLMCSFITKRKLSREDFLNNHPGGSLGIEFSKK